MSRMLFIAGVLAFAFSVIAAGPADARKQKQWVQLGSQIASFKKDRDIIKVGRQAGAFDRIRLKVRRNGIFVQRIKIFFGNGDEQTVRIRGWLPADVESSAIRLDGGVRWIDHIELFYRSANVPSRSDGFRKRQGKRALVEVWGEQVVAPPAARTHGWRMLAREVVHPVWKEEVIHVGTRAGRFKNIVLRVLRNPVIFRSFVVTFGNGQKQAIALPRRINAGQNSGAATLDGARFIKNVRITYRTRRRSSARAIVEVWADPVKRQPKPPVVARLPKNWVALGTGIAEFDNDRDTIKVGKVKGKFAKIIFRVRRANVYIRHVSVIYGTGEKDTVRIRETVRAGGRQRTLELKGDRYIKEIVLRYRTPQDATQRARVQLYGQLAKGWRGAGRRATAKPGPVTQRDGWVLLGRQKAGLGVDRDVVRIGRQLGRFRQVRLDVRGKGRRGVRIYDVKVIYANGEVGNIFVPKKIPLGGSSGPLDLAGRRRSIEEIQLVYRTRLNLFGETYVEVWGRR